MNIKNISRFFSPNDNNKNISVGIVVILCFLRKNSMNIAIM